MRVSEYFNPFSSQFPNTVQHFKNLGFWSKAAVVGLTALAGTVSFFALGIGGVAMFRFTVKVFSGGELPKEAAKVDEVRERVLAPETPEEERDSLADSQKIKVNNKTQHDLEDGSTGIYLKIAKRLLEASPDQVNADLIDEIPVEREEDYDIESHESGEFGLKRWKFDEKEGFSYGKPPYSGTVNQFKEMIAKAAQDLPKPTALIIKSVFKTALVVIRPSGEFWLFGSCGSDGTYVRKFSSEDQFVKKLGDFFPFVDLEGDQQDSLPINFFNAYAFVENKIPEEEQDSLAAFSRIEANITQYDPLLDNAGKSACTCICLKAAEMLLEASPDQVNAGLIDDILVEGVADYNRFKVGGVVEHTSVENYELNTFELKRLEFRDVDNPFSAEGNPYAGTLDSFAKMMEKASDSKDLPKPVALVMTKSNMTITIVIRPDGKYWLFDPHGTNGKGAYIESCNTDELIKKIKEIFPKTSYPGMTEDENLGFNSFEAYAVRRS